MLKIELPGMRKRDRPQKRILMDIVKEDCVTEEGARDRVICCDDP